MSLKNSKPAFYHPDFDIHSIWYCRNSDDPEIDFVFVPAIGATGITESICKDGPPCIPLHLENTELRCSGYYDASKDTVFNVVLLMDGEPRHFTYAEAPRTPAIVVSDVPIFGVPKRRFLQRSEKDWYTEKLDA